MKFGLTAAKLKKNFWPPRGSSLSTALMVCISCREGQRETSWHSVTWLSHCSANTSDLRGCLQIAFSYLHCAQYHILLSLNNTVTLNTVHIIYLGFFFVFQRERIGDLGPRDQTWLPVAFHLAHNLWHQPISHVSIAAALFQAETSATGSLIRQIQSACASISWPSALPQIRIRNVETTASSQDS